MIPLQDHAKTHNILQEFITTILNLLSTSQGTDQRGWFRACEEVLGALFLIHDNPELVAESFINSLTNFIVDNKTLNMINKCKDVYLVLLFIA